MHVQVLCEQVEHGTSPEVITTFHLLTKNLNMHGETEAANTIHHRLVGPRYTLSPAEAIIITHCTSLEAWVFKQSLYSGTPTTGT